MIKTTDQTYIFDREKRDNWWGKMARVNTALSDMVRSNKNLGKNFVVTIKEVGDKEIEVYEQRT